MEETVDIPNKQIKISDSDAILFKRLKRVVEGIEAGSGGKGCTRTLAKEVGEDF